MKKLALLGLFALGCKEQVKAIVNCEVKDGPTVECAIKQTEGTTKIEVCWDFTVTCANKAMLDVQHACAKVKNGGATNLIIPSDKIKMTGTCEGASEAAITGMTINGKASQRF